MQASKLQLISPRKDYSPSELENIRTQALIKLRKKPISLNELDRFVTIFSVNSNQMTRLIHPGYEKLMQVSYISLNGSASDAQSINNEISNSKREVLALVIEESQNKEIKNYFDLIFGVEASQDFPLFSVAHVSPTTLKDACIEFLKGGSSEEKRQIEVFSKSRKNIWKTFTNIDELEEVSLSPMQPIVLDRPFFSEIELILPGKNKRQEKFPIPNLRSVQKLFSASKQSGIPNLSDANIAIPIKNIVALKLATSLPQNVVGISIQGKFYQKKDLIELGFVNDYVRIADIDYIQTKSRLGLKNVVLNQTPNLAINLDHLQVTLKPIVTVDDLHIENFKALVLYKNQESTRVDKVIPYYPSAFQDQSIQHYLMSSYQHLEMMHRERNTKEEIILLSKHNVVAGDLIAHQVMKSMQQIKFFPWTINLLGYAPQDIGQLEKLKNRGALKFEELSKLITDILDDSKTPFFEQNNLFRLTKEQNDFLKLESLNGVKSDNLIALKDELEELIRFIDKFFRLDIYKKWETDLSTDDRENDLSLGELTEHKEEVHFDDATKKFVQENFKFFRKRRYIKDAIRISTELHFYLTNIAPVYDKSLRPGVIVFAKNKFVEENYKESSIPSCSIQSLFKSEIFSEGGEEEEVEFSQFIREFIVKVLRITEKNGQTFLHQFKHTLAEVDYELSQRLDSLESELKLLEDPEGQEEAYKILLKQVTKIYYDHLEQQNSELDRLKEWLDEIGPKRLEIANEMAALFEENWEADSVEFALERMPNRINSLTKNTSFSLHEKRDRMYQISQSLRIFHNAVIEYYGTIESNSSQFFEAQYIHQQTQILEESVNTCKQIVQMDKEQLQQKLTALENFKIDKKQIQALQKDVKKLHVALTNHLSEINQSNLSALKNEIKDTESLTDQISFQYSKAEKLKDLVKDEQNLYQKLLEQEKEIYAKQKKLARFQAFYTENFRLMKIIKERMESQIELPEILKIIKQRKPIPVEIKEVLAKARKKMNSAVLTFKEKLRQYDIEHLCDFKTILENDQLIQRVHILHQKINDMDTEYQGCKKEIQYIEEDVAFLKTQEGNLEKVALAKSIPSTRVLIKDHYLPEIQNELLMLRKANRFLEEITIRDMGVINKICDHFYRKRFFRNQFLHAVVFQASYNSIEGNTEKNINGAYTTLKEKHHDFLRTLKKKSIGYNYVFENVDNKEQVKNKIKSMYQNEISVRSVFLPAFLDLEEALDLCEFKDNIYTAENPFKAEFPVFIYVHDFNVESLIHNEVLKKKYEQSLLNNIFINIDGITIYDNKSSILEALFQQTFGVCVDGVSKELMKDFEVITEQTYMI